MHVLGLAGCGGDLFVESPAFRPEILTILFAASNDGQRFDLYAASTEPSVTRVEVDGDAPVLFALGYTYPLRALHLDEGRIESPPETNARSVETPPLAFEADLGAGSWLDIDGDALPLSRLHLPKLDLPRCLSEGGCLSAEAGLSSAAGLGSPFVCNLDCKGWEGSVVLDPPAPAAPPELTPCPAGWATRPSDTDPSVTTCAPPPPITCGPGHAQFFGESDCAPIGDPCPASDWPAVSGSALFVKASAAPGGDGSSAQPFQTIQEAIDAATGPTTIAIAVGDYPDPVTIRAPGLTLLGACVEGVRVGENAARAGIEVQASGVEIRSLSVRGMRAIDVVDAGAGALIVGVELQSHIEVRGTTGVVIERSRGSAGAEVHAFDGAEVVLRRVRLEADGRVAAFGGQITAEGLLIDARESGSSNRGALSVSDGGRLDVRGAAIHDVADHVLRAARGGVASLQDLFVITSSAARSTQRFNRGVWAASSSVSLSRVYISDSQEAGVFVHDMAPGPTRGTLSLTDVIVERAADTGLRVANSEAVHLARVLLGGNTSRGVYFEPGDTQAVFEDVQILGTRLHEDGTKGEGLVVDPGQSITAKRLAVIDSVTDGIWLYSEDGRQTSVEIEDLTIDGIQANALGFGGKGITVGESGQLMLRRAEISGCASFGILSEGTRAEMDLFDVHLTSCGFGIISSSELGRLAASRVILSDVSIGISAQESTSAVLSDIEIHDVDAFGLVADGLELGVPDAEVVIERFIIRGAPTGIRADSSSLSLGPGRISNADVGVLVRRSESALPTAALMRAVRYEDNERDIVRP